MQLSLLSLVGMIPLINPLEMLQLVSLSLNFVHLCIISEFTGLDTGGIDLDTDPDTDPDTSCPRNREEAAARGRTCLRKCKTDADCISNKKRCLCDGLCGWSCVRPGKRALL